MNGQSRNCVAFADAALLMWEVQEGSFSVRRVLKQ
jgi:hypothetical protein